MTTSELELLTRWRRGERAAGDALIAAYAQPLYRFFTTKADGFADDLMQQVFVGLLEGAGRFEARASLRAYVFAIARRQLHKHYRDRQRHRLPDGSASPLRDQGTSPSGNLARQQTHDLLHRALERLPIDQRIALELTYWEELQPEEVAEVLQVPRNTVYSRLRRARTQLHEALYVLDPRAEPADIPTRLRDAARLVQRPPKR